MTKPVLDYVFSAPNMLQLSFATNELNDADKQVFKDFVFPQIIKNIKGAVALKNFDNRLSLLFNAFVEANVFELAKQYNNYGVDSIYGDSGGLQIVTLR